MNFKLLISIFAIAFVLTSCGVKSAPAIPQDSPIPSYSAQFLSVPPTPDTQDESTSKKDVP